MSQAAVTAAEACTHLKGGALALLKAIAEHIPDGETTTPPMTLDELTARLPHVDRTVRTSRDFLSAQGFIKVHDGGRGKKARYEMLNIAGVRPVTAAPLPLRADLHDAKSRRTKEQRKTSAETADLFDERSAVSADVRETRVYDIGSFCRRWVIKVGSFCRRWWDRTKEQRKTSAVSADVGAPASIDRARDVHTKNTKNVHTHPASFDPAPKSADAKPPPPCRYTGTVHAWCGGRVHVPMELHRELLRKHRRLAGETEADVEAALVAFYQRRSAAIAPDAQLPSNDFAFWRPAYAKEFLSTVPPRAGPAPHRDETRGDDVWSAIRQRIKGQMNRDSFFTWFGPTVLVKDDGQVIHVAGTGDHGAQITAWIQQHYTDVVARAVQEVRPGARVEFVTEVDEQKYG